MDDRASNLQGAARRPDADPFAPSAQPGNNHLRRVLGVVLGIAIMVLASQAGKAQSIWEVISKFIGLHGKPEPASGNVLSEHEMEALDQMSPQAQAQLLLERSINHYRGANDQIAARVGKWRGQITLDASLNSLFTTALNSDDLRVRAAAIEIDIAARNLDKSGATVDRLEADARYGQQGHARTPYGTLPCSETAAYSRNGRLKLFPLPFRTATRTYGIGRWKVWLILVPTRPSNRCWRFFTTIHPQIFGNVQPADWLSPAC